MKYLASIGFDSGAVQDRLKNYLEFFGYTGTNPDMLLTAVKNGVFLDAPVFSSDLYLDYNRQLYTASSLTGQELLSFSPLHTFTRASDKTYFDQNGVLQTAGPNVPVFDYDPVTKKFRLSVNEQRTNLLRYSEDFGSVVWAKAVGGTASAPVVTVNAGVAPDGTTTADRIQFALNGGTSSGDRSDVTQNVTVPSLTTTSRLVYIKSNTSQSYDLVFGSNAPTSTTTKITVTPEWQRFDLNHTANATSSNIYFGLRNAGGVTGVSDSADVLVWGAQLEVGSFPTPYIKTEATTATRNADVAVILGVDSSEWWDSNAGSFEVTARAKVGNTVLKVGAFEIISDSDTMKTYSGSYTSEAATTLEIMPGANGFIQEIIYEQ